MPLYLTRFSYTAETWARLIGNPEDRRKAAQSYIESVGGELHGFWYAFGKHDGYTLWEAPDNVSMAAVALAISSGGALSSLETIVLLTVDEAITGIGSGGVPVRWEVAGLFLMGQDPFALEQHVANLRSMAFFVGRPWPVEIALWDIIGKATGQPVYKLLGGGSDKLKAYASTGELRPTEARVESAQQIVSEGFRALKLRFHSADWRDDVKTLEAVRMVVGDDIDIMVDANWGWRIAPDRQLNRWDLKTAISAAKAMEDYGVYWLEEPLDAYDYDGLAELRSHMTTLRL